MSINIGMAAVPMGIKNITKEQLDEVIKQHGLWLKDHTQGKRAELNGYSFGNHITDVKYDLSGVDLSEADLSGSSFVKAKLVGIKLAGAKLEGSVFMEVDLTDAVLDDVNLQGGTLSHSNLTRVHAVRANFNDCCLWDNCWKEAVLAQSQMVHAQLCDGHFEGANLCSCNMLVADIDYAHFENADLSYANMRWTANSYWAYFQGADMNHVIFDGSPINDDAVEGAKNLHIPMLCPDEGSFIGWKKCRDNRIMKIQITEGASRTGGYANDIRASEILVLEIYDGDKTCSEAVCLSDEKMIYHKGDVVRDTEEFDPSLLHDGEGIHLFLSRAEAERFEYKSNDDKEDSEEGDENGD